MSSRIPMIITLAAGLLLGGGGAMAQSAPWYKWQGAAARTVCAQTSPGPGWKRLGGPYVKADCSL